MVSPDINRATWETPWSADAALDRLRTRVLRPRIGSSVSGDYRTGPAVVGTYKTNRFDLRLQRFVANPYAPHAFGVVESNGLGSVVAVRFGRVGWASWIRWGSAVFFLFLIAVQFIAATHQPVFFVGVGFLTVMGALVMWQMRWRDQDRRALYDFLRETFKDA